MSCSISKTAISYMMLLYVCMFGVVFVYNIVKQALTVAYLFPENFLPYI